MWIPPRFSFDRGSFKAGIPVQNKSYIEVEAEIS